MTRLALAIAPGAGAGYFPVAPGTAGSAIGLLVYLAARAAGGAWGEAAAIALTCVAGTWAASRAEVHFGRTDPGQVVVDEVAGMLVTLAFLPVSTTGLLVGFLLFRVFDIVKPPPARSVERWPQGLGIMADDVVAGCYAHAFLRIGAWAAPAWILG
jgi:phosphatidylglycerophosphatase A